MSEKIHNQPRKFPTGMTVLDQKLGGRFSDKVKGIPEGSIVLVFGPPESNLGTLFAQKVILNLLHNNQNSKAFYMHSSRPRGIIVNEFLAYEWDIDKYISTNRWQFIDMWDITSSHVASSSKIGKIDIRRKTYLKQAFEKIRQDLRRTETIPFTIVDNLLWLKEDEFDTQASKMLEFFKELIDIITDIGGIHFFVLPKGILEKTAENIIISVVNGIIEFSRKVVGNSNKDRLSIVKMMGVTYDSDILEISPDERDGLTIESTSSL